jgi:hypothetical protein
MDMEKMRLAISHETERLSDYFKYEDGSVDQPLLTPDTLIKEESNDDALHRKD